jgi:hypothetical protein
MNVVDTVMVWLGFERCDQPATATSDGKVLYRKRGADVTSAQNFLATSSVGESAARAHVELTLFDKAVLWIFEKIVSPFINPSPVTNVATVLDGPAVLSEGASVFSEEERLVRAAEKEFSDLEKFIGQFLKIDHWPRSGNSFSNEVRSVAESHWESYKGLTDKSITNEKDRLTYAAAAYVLNKDKPSFDPPKVEPVPVVVFQEHSPPVGKKDVIIEPLVPTVSKGEALFRQFVQLYSAVDFKEPDSLGSLFFQAECLEFARKIISDNGIADIKNRAAPPKSDIAAAEYLQKRKTILEGKAEEALRRREHLENAERIESEKNNFRDGEWEFNQFTEKFIRRRDNNEKFILLKNGKYLKNDQLLAFAATVPGDPFATSDQKQAADYLSKWKANPDAATEAAANSETFSFPPEPAKPAPRRVAAPKLEPPPVAPERIALTEFVNADALQQQQLLRLIPVSEAVFLSGLEVFRQIWSPEVSDKNGRYTHDSQAQLSGSELHSYTNLEKADNAIKIVSEIAVLATSHDIGLSKAIEVIKEHEDEINRSLLQHRRQIIESRKILSVEELTPVQLAQGQQLFSEFSNSFSASNARNDLDKFVMRDIYFSDECMSYASYMQTILLSLKVRSDSDQDSLNAAAYLMNKYQGFKSSIREPDSAVI